VEVVSPELALVDPDLALRARWALPLPGDCLAPGEPLGSRRPVAAVPRVVELRRPSLLAAVAALIAASLIGLPGPPAGLRAAVNGVAHVLQQARSAATP
jgi:hypothetical protein